MQPLEQQRYGLVILDFDVASSPDSVYLTPRVVGAMRRQYRLATQIVSHWVYAPHQAESR